TGVQTCALPICVCVVGVCVVGVCVVGVCVVGGAGVLHGGCSPGGESRGGGGWVGEGVEVALLRGLDVEDDPRAALFDDHGFDQRYQGLGCGRWADVEVRRRS